MSHHVANKLLSGETLPELVPLDEHWRTARKQMKERQDEAYWRMQQQWFKLCNEDPNTQTTATSGPRVWHLVDKSRDAFTPPFARYEDIKPAGLSVRAMFILVGGALVFFTALAVVILMIYRG